MVDRDRDALSPHPGRPALRMAVLAGGLLCFAAPPSLLAASSIGNGCDSVARELKSVEIPVETLTIDLSIAIVDHMAEDHGAVDPAIGHEHDPTAPLLFLTPRVAHILQDVFGDADAAADEATPMERVRKIMLAAKAQAPQATVEPPAAGGDADGEPGADLDERNVSSGPLAETFYDVDTLPRFQRRMYRNDI